MKSSVKSVNWDFGNESGNRIKNQAKKNGRNQSIILLIFGFCLFCCIRRRNRERKLLRIKPAKKNHTANYFLESSIFFFFFRFSQKRQLKQNAVACTEPLSLRINRVKLLLTRSSRRRIRHAASISYYTQKHFRSRIFAVKQRKTKKKTIRSRRQRNGKVYFGRILWTTIALPDNNGCTIKKKKNVIRRSWPFLELCDVFYSMNSDRKFHSIILLNRLVFIFTVHYFILKRKLN